MIQSIPLFRTLAAAALLALAGSAHAGTQYQFYTSEQSFTDAVDRPATDTFSDWSNLVGTTISTSDANGNTIPIPRTDGDFGYSLFAYSIGLQSYDDLYVSGDAGNPSVTASSTPDILIMDSVTGNPNAVGLNLYGVDATGAFTAGASYTLEVLDSNGNDVMQTITPTSATDGSFVGFVSSGTIEIVNVYIQNLASGSSTIPFVTMDNVTLSTATLAAAVPEPASYAMLMAGLGFVGVVARRHRRA